MAAPKLSTQDKKDLDKFSKYLVYKCIQIIVQSRLGEKIKTQSKSVSSGSDWFNLAIKDIPEIITETKKVFTGTSLAAGQHVCVEISLKTAEGDTMILETWWLNMKEQTDSNARVSYTVYNRMGILLKSLFCVTRVTPAYRLSRKQGAETFVICYRIYLGDPQIFSLGEGYINKKVGLVPTPVGTIFLNVAYRTKLLISPQQATRDFNLDLRDNHFAPDGSPKRTIPRPCPTANGFKDIRGSPAEEIFYCESQSDCCATSFSTSPPDPYLHPANFFGQPTSPPPSSKQGTNKKNFGEKQETKELPKQQSFSKAQKCGAFASYKDFDKSNSDSDDVPFISLLQPSDEADLNGASSNGDLNHNGNIENEAIVGSAGSSSKSTASGYSGNDDFVVVELKTPFAATDANSDLCKFYRECTGPPPLTMFDNSSSVEQTLNSITNQLAMFESQIEDFDDFVNEIQDAEED